jgi:uncharacterized protein YbjT (DUF2867 family)
MKILICGATGFVGRHLASTLTAAGHTVVRGVRKTTHPGDIAIDFRRDTGKETWLPRLAGVDAVVNAVGVLRDTAAQPMRLLLEQTPLALLAACKEAEVSRIVQVSANGIDQRIETPYFHYRREPEAFLNKLPDSMRFLILRPSIIYGEDGASAKIFRLQARLPVHFLPDGGRQKLQPVHIDDICSAVEHWLADPAAASQTVIAVGAEATDMRGMLDSYRQQLKGDSAACHVGVPAFLVKLTAKAGDFIPSSPLCSDTLKMLEAGNTGDTGPFAKLLGRAPRSYRAFIREAASDASG